MVDYSEIIMKYNFHTTPSLNRTTFTTIPHPSDLYHLLVLWQRNFSDDLILQELGDFHQAFVDQSDGHFFHLFHLSPWRRYAMACDGYGWSKSEINAA